MLDIPSELRTIANGLQTLIIAGLWLYIRHHHARFVTKQDLTSALDAFGDKFWRKLMGEMNGDQGFMRKSECVILHESIVSDVSACAKETQRLRDRLLPERQKHDT